MRVVMRRILVGLLVLAALAAGAYWLFADRIHVDLTRDELQAGVEKAFPYENCKLLLIACITFSEPRVELPLVAPESTGQTAAPNRLRLDLKLAVSAFGKQTLGQIGVSGALRYDADEAKLYLDDARIEKFDVDAISKDVAEMIRTRAPVLLRIPLERTPIYAFNEESLHHRLARLTVRDMRVVDGKLRIRFRAPRS
jgi:hypothetical protein